MRNWLAVLASALLTVGCGSSEGLVPIEGVVTLDDAPLPNAQVLFYEPGGGPETNFTDITDAEGRFTLSPIRSDKPGVKPGKYQVTLRTGFAGPDLLETDPLPRELVPPAQQEFEHEVPAGGDTAIEFKIRSK